MKNTSHNDQPFFAGIRDSGLIKELSKEGERKVFKPGEIILREHAYIKSIPLILRGAVKVTRQDEDGNELLLYYIKPGEGCIMSFLGSFNQDSSKVTALADKETEVLLLPSEKAAMLVFKYPEFAGFIFRLYQKKFEELLLLVNAVAFHKLDTRIMQFLQKKAARDGVRELHITHRQLAEELGTAREVASRLLKQLESLGKIKLARNRITLL